MEGGGGLRRGDAAPYGAACAHFLLHGPLGYPNTYTILGTTRYPGSPYAKTCQWRITHKHHARWQRNSERRPTCACTLVRNIDGLCGVVLSRRAPVGHPPYIYFWVVLFRDEPKWAERERLLAGLNAPDLACQKTQNSSS